MLFLHPWIPGWVRADVELRLRVHTDAKHAC